MGDITVDKLEYIQKKFERLYRLAFHMRHWWIRYSKTHASKDKERAQHYQRELDKMLRQEGDLKKSLLQELF